VKKSNIKCFYHGSDLDGKYSSMITYLFFNNNKSYNIEFYPLSYEDDFLFSMIDKEDEVIMLDFCLQPESKMIQLKKSCKQLIWIDHHKSSIESLKNEKIDGIQKVGKAGCELTWEYFFTNFNIPEVIRLLGRYDVWDKSNLFEWENRILPFQFGMRIYNFEHNYELWTEILQKDFIENTIKKGKAIIKYLEKDNADFALLNSYEIEIDGLKAIVMNRKGNSQMFNSVWDKDKYDCMVGYVHNGEVYTISLYTDKPGIDVSLIAKKYGGGGHKQASGFQIKELPFKKVGDKL
jgi:oligoribonuclease NrnB/cAMP/cGMP phosphodiesterase (DHH superfamily)